MDRSFGRFWSRARSKLYEEPRKLVDRGLVKAAEEQVGRRRRTVFAITPAGRRELAGWLAEPGGGPGAGVRAAAQALPRRARHPDGRLVASSPDLLGWHRDGMLLRADSRWYETLEQADEEHWRDPHVVRAESTGRWHMLLTARVHSGPSDERGAVGHLSSADLRHWTTHEPVYGPGDFRQLEVTQLLHLGGRWRILFSAGPGDHSRTRAARDGHLPEGGTHYLSCDEQFGRYRLDRDAFLVGDPACRHYAGRMLEHGGRWWFFAWLENDDAGRFVGELSDPMPVGLDPDGTPRVQLPN